MQGKKKFQDIKNLLTEDLYKKSPKVLDEEGDCCAVYNNNLHAFVVSKDDAEWWED